MPEQPLSEFSPSIHRAVHQLGLDAATAEVIAALDAKGIRSILIKGPTISRWLYEDHDLRGYGDIDLLVSPADQAGTALILSELGFTLWHGGLTPDEISELGAERGIAWHALKWVRSSPPISVDLHRTIPGVGVDPSDLWDALARDSQRLTVSGRAVEVPGEPAQALIVALQAAKDGVASQKAVADLGRALALVRAPVWRDAARLAERLQALPAFTAGLLLLPDGEARAERLGLGVEMEVETALRIRSAPRIAYAFQRMAEMKGLAPKAAFVVRELVPTRLFMLYRFPVARRGPVGLFLAHLQRLLWLLRQAGTGFVAWRRARKEVR
jgi:putative nucleotidyltransferase-like protein